MIRSEGRTAEAVLYDHLERRRCGDLEGDLKCNYAEDLVVLSKDGVYHGKDGIRRTAEILHEMLPDATYSYDLVRLDGDVALLSWSAEAANGARTCDGVDTFVIRDGRIKAQTIHYSVH